MFTKLFLLMSFSVTSAFAHEGSVPEFFYQADEGQMTVQGELNVILNNLEIGANEQELDAMQLKGWLNYGITENFAIQFGVPFVLNTNVDVNGTSLVDGDSGFNDFELNLLVHREMGSMLLFYGVEGAITLDKTGSGPNFFSEGHTFNPYLGLSMGDHCKYGAKLTYRSISTDSGANGGTGGNGDYDLEFFGEVDKEDSYLLGGSLGYLQTSGVDDSLALGFYGRVYFEKFTFVPRITYTHNLNSDIDSQLNLTASLGVRKSF